VADRPVSTFIREELAKFGLGPIMQEEIAAVPETPESFEDFDRLLASYIALKQLHAKITARLEAIKPTLHACADKFGEESDKGHKSVKVGENVLTREKSVPTLPDLQLLKALLETREIPYNAVFVESTVREFSPTHLLRLIETGKIKESEIEAMRAPTYRITLKAGRELEKAIKYALGDDPSQRAK